MGVGSLVVIGMLTVVFFFLFEVLPEWTTKVNNHFEFPMAEDDPDNPVAKVRAWDRRLIALGMLPISNSEDPLTIKVSNGTRYYLDFTLDERNHIILRRHWIQKALPKS